jgi:hypothetical protein
MTPKTGLIKPFSSQPRYYFQPFTPQPNWKCVMTDKAPKLLDQVHARICVMHYSIRTEQVYVDWTWRFILFHHKRHPRDMGKTDRTGIVLGLFGGRAPGIGLDAVAGQIGAAAPVATGAGSRPTVGYSRPVSIFTNGADGK